jgi:lipopolysaccharide export system permease protein
VVKRIDRYIGKTVIAAVLTVWLALTLLMLMFGLLQQLGSSGGQTLFDLFWYILLTTPRLAYQVFPVSALLGALIGLGGLAAGNELVAFRTSGASRLRIAGSTLSATMLLTLFVLFMGERIAPAAEEQARAFKHAQIEGKDLFGGERGIWVRDGSDFVNIRRPLLAADRGEHRMEFRWLVIYSLDDEGRMNELTQVRVAVHDGEQWIFQGVDRIRLGPDGLSGESRATEPWDTTISPDLLDSAVSRPRYMSIRTLVEQLDYLDSNGLDSRVYRSAFWAKLFYPLTVLSLVLAGMPFVFGSARHHSIGVRLFIGMSLGGVFMIVSRVAQNMGDAYELPAVLTTSAPSLLLALVVFAVLRRSV